ncbi:MULTISPECIES: hypothetical protein [unclassified Microbacterium]|uniref:hypothetical protein n=1 Tax=unclassified Microbacterium TaxID=2609290 RepID=UPI0004936DFE|nr:MULTISPECIES: hypothetical protein [unclassified Microbacterium]
MSSFNRGSLRDIVGADRGISTQSDILTRTADGVNLNRLWNEFVDDLAAWNETRNVIANLFASNTSESFALLPNGGSTVTMEKSSEFGVPTASRVTPEQLRMGFPLEWFDAGVRYTRRFLRDATAEQIRAQHAGVLEADNRLVFANTMSALTNRTAGARPVNENGVTIYDLWDGTAGEVPPSYAGKTFTDSHTHYLVSGAATVDGGDLKSLIDTIQEHGHGLRSSNEQIVIFANPIEADVITGFRRDEANPGKDPYDFIPSVSAPAYLTDVTIVGDKAPAQFNGVAIEGSYGDAWITKNHFIPAGYVIAVATAGPRNSRNPLWFREHPSADSRGLRLLPTYERYPLVDATYEHGFGVGVRHRSAAAVVQIKASGSYQNPTWVA